MTRVLLCLLLLGCRSVLVGALPDGFIVETVTSEARGTSGLFAPHPGDDKKPPILLIVEKEGKVTVLENPDESPTAKTILDLDGKLCTDGERGLQSIAIHPNFKNNRFVYLYYTEYLEGCPKSLTTGTWNTVHRFVMDPVTLELDYESREEIWRTTRTRYNIHNGGAMAFGNDGKLYVTTGDSGRKTLAQPTDNTHGKIIRLNEDGSIPEDNPFTTANGYEGYRCADTDGNLPDTATNGICAEIFAHGLRNPFRMRMDPTETEKVKFNLGDVGGAYWEELNVGGTDYAGRNYGWPLWEGPCRESSFTDCPIPTEISGVEPYHFYEHKSSDEGGAVAGSAFVPPGLWPSEYKFLFMDFILLRIYNLIEEPSRECRSCLPPTSGYRNETFYHSYQQEGEHVNSARMVDMFFGPYKDSQALYVIRFGNHDTVLRIRYNGILGNTPPIADFQIPDVAFEIGKTVIFDGSISRDADGDVLTFEWDFGDGFTSSEVSPSHQFEKVGEYDVVLKVTDAKGQTQQKTETVTVGVPPVARIFSPAEGDVFYVGEVLQLAGVAYDHTGTRLDDTQYSWEVRKYHADHFHPFMDATEGNRLSLYPAPEPEDFFATTNSYLMIILVATDKSGLSTQVERIVKPSLVRVGIDSDPRGLSVIVDNFPVTAFRTAVSWKEHDLRLEAEDQNSYRFKSWSDGSTDRQRTMKLSRDYQTIQANFCKEDQLRCSTSEECCSENCVKEMCQPITKIPVLSPTTRPTTRPTTKPTSKPTAKPSVKPTSRPTTNLTTKLTMKPTMKSTVKPTIRPTSLRTTAAPVEISPDQEPTGSEQEKTPRGEEDDDAVSEPPLAEPKLSSTSDVEREGKSSTFIATTLLSFIIAAFILVILPVMVFKAKQIKRQEQRELAAERKQFYHYRNFIALPFVGFKARQIHTNEHGEILESQKRFYRDRNFVDVEQDNTFKDLGFDASLTKFDSDTASDE